MRCISLNDCNYPTLSDDFSIGDLLNMVNGTDYHGDDRTETCDYLDDLESALWRTFGYWYANKVRCEQPSIINHYIKTGHITRCEICNHKLPLELHHIIPVCQGGGNERSNIIFVCRNCHKRFRSGEGRQKGDVLVTKKNLWIKREIQIHHKDYDGEMNDKELMQYLGVARNTYYKYKRELKHDKAGSSGFSF